MAHTALFTDTRLTYTGVVMQQGRVPLDADAAPAAQTWPRLVQAILGPRIRISPAPPHLTSSNVRRLSLTIEQTLTSSLHFAATMANAAPLWAMVTARADAYLQTLFRQGTLQGTTANQAYFSLCGPQTMTQADIAAGRLILIVGFAPLRPAEFVILRIGLQAKAA